MLVTRRSQGLPGGQAHRGEDMGETSTSETGLSVTAGLAAISARLTDAAAVAKAAVVCAEAGCEREAVRIALDLDEILSEATTLHAAVCLIGRINRRAAEATVTGD